MGLLKEFREFALKGNVIDLAVGVIIGGAFGGIINSFIGDIVMPTVGWITRGGVNWSDKYYPLSDKVPEGLSLAEAKKAGNVLAYGNFITVLINFLIIALCIFLVVKAFNHARKRFEREQPPPAPAAPPAEVKLLTEIRDLLARQAR